MEPSKKINIQQIYPQPKNNRKSRIAAESSNSSNSSNSSGSRNGGEGANGLIDGPKENRVIAESGDILPILPTGEEIFNEEDPFLLVSLASMESPPPKDVSYLYMFALLDLSIITICTILLVHKDKQGHWHWRKAAWDWVALGLIRFIVVVGIASSKWIRELRWILGGACCNRKSIGNYRLILLISSFLFCQIHWIAYVVATTDSRHKARFLRDQSVIFEEESRHNPYADGAYTEDALSHRDISSRSYGATVNRDDEIDVLDNNDNH